MDGVNSCLAISVPSFRRCLTLQPLVPQVHLFPICLLYSSFYLLGLVKPALLPLERVPSSSGCESDNLKMFSSEEFLTVRPKEDWSNHFFKELWLESFYVAQESCWIFFTVFCRFQKMIFYEQKCQKFVRIRRLEWRTNKVCLSKILLLSFAKDGSKCWGFLLIWS